MNEKKLLIVMMLSLSLIPMTGVRGENEDVAVPEPSYLEEGKKYFIQGNFEEALSQWQKAEDSKSSLQDQSQKYVLDMLRGEAYRGLGQYQKASTYFNKALQDAREANDFSIVTQLLDKLGAMAFELGDRERALEILREGLRLARESGDSSSLAGLLNSMGNVLTSMDRNNEALGAYTEAAALAGKSQNEELELVALINSAKAASQERLVENSEERLDLALEKIDSLSDGYGKMNGLLTVGILYSGLELQKGTLGKGKGVNDNGSLSSRKGQRGVRVESGSGPQVLDEIIVVPESDFAMQAFPRTEKTEGKSLKLRAFETLQKAKDTARELGDRRGESYALGHLGHLYEKNGQFEEALDLTRQAVAVSQKAMATESLYQWHWQTARILRNQGEWDSARQAYQRAISVLQPIRSEVSIAYQVRTETFREGVGKIYFELADLLLTRAKIVSEKELGPQYLIEARNTIEDFKAAELQDYFQEDCVEPSQTLTQTLNTASPNTAILYPILLKDRIELIANFPSGLKQYTSGVSDNDVTQVARRFRLELQELTNQRFQASSKQLYDWLIKPLEEDLAKENIQTLVFVPDGALRAIPIAALHDGERFLIEKYALATTPGVTLTDPKPLNRASMNILSLGITESVQGFPALPYVGKEMKSLQGMYKGKQLLNEDFVVKSMRQQLKDEDYNIVHIASHGLVESNVENTFVLAYDEKITMNRLAELVGLFRFRKSPLELLTLSACETAAGDDRAALGLAGVAVKAGARSALATLWFIDDAVTSDLIGEFYQQLNNPKISKAQALQAAQRKILEYPEYRHPNFWSPFLLINNWL
jgi:CHAT domain-containing protein